MDCVILSNILSAKLKIDEGFETYGKEKEKKPYVTCLEKLSGVP